MRIDSRLLSVIGVVLLVGGGLLISTLVLPAQADTSGDWSYTRPPPDSTNTTTTANTTTTSTTGMNTTTTPGSPWFNLHYELSLDFLDESGNLVYTQPFALISNLDDAEFETMQISLLWETTGDQMVWSTYDLDIYTSVVIDTTVDGVEHPRLALTEFLDQPLDGAETIDVSHATLDAVIRLISAVNMGVPLIVEVEFDIYILDDFNVALDDTQLASLSFQIYSAAATNSVIALPGLFGMSSTTGGLNPMTNAAMWPILLGGLLLFYFYVLPMMGRRK